MTWEKQLQVTNSFKLDFPTYPSRELNEMSAEETSGDVQEVNEIARNKRWVSNSSTYNQKCSNFINNHNKSYRHQQQQPQENKQTKQWRQKPRDSKITLTQESDHYVPSQFSGDFFRKFDLTMKLKQDELKEQKGSSRQVNEITENNFIQAFGVTEDQMDKAAAMLSRSESTQKLGNSLAWLAKDIRTEEVSNSTVEKEVFIINTCKTKGTTFKIKVKDLTFSSLFDTGAQVSCIKYDTVSELELLHQILESSTCIRTANGQDVGVKGSILESFQIRPCSLHIDLLCLKV